AEICGQSGITGNLRVLHDRGVAASKRDCYCPLRSKEEPMERSFALAVLTLTVALAASAQTNSPSVEIIGRYVRVNPQGSTSFSDIGMTYKQDSGNGFGVGINYRFSRPLSIELAYAQANSGAKLDAGTSAGTLSLGSLKLRPVT